MERESKPDVSQTDEFVNYLPAMPSVSGEPGVLERLVDGLFRRTD